MAAKVLVVGSGSREDALSWKLAQSNSVGQVFVSPGNAGSDLARDKIKTISLDMHKHEKVVSWCKDNNINMVVIGPEDLLANGLSDDLTKAGIPCFGPSAQAAQIESSKAFSKDLMTKNGVPTARWQAFTNSKEACEFINSSDFPALVVKASGLASGKGVIIAADKEAACQAVVDVLDGQLFGNAGSTVVIEELLEGDEISCLAFCDGKTFVCMPPAQDHKRLLDGDQGPNTGGMGAYCPCPLISDDALELVKKEVLQKTLDALRDIGSPFVGVLYAGLMLTKNGPKVLEFNCRFGDPETQVLLPLLKSDLYQILDHCVQGKLQSTDVQFDTAKTALGVVLASSGYPATYRKGLPITNIDSAQSKYNANIFYAGAALEGEQVITRGGRVLTVVVTAPDMDTASKMAQQAANEIQFEGKQFRTDIGFRALRPTQLSQLTYKDSGVDIEAGDCLVEKIKSLAASTVRLGCNPNLGSFGGLFDMKAIGYTDPLLVSGTDGVGTKLKIAQSIGIHNTVGIDLVAMCVNDILCHGAEPLFFLDYFACGFLELDATKSVIEGISVGCRQANCALIGGETAEMPGMYQRGEYDLAGFAVGAVERSLCLPKLNDIHEGDVIIGLMSSGLHSNGFSLVRKVVDKCQLAYDSPSPFDPSKTLGESLLVPTKIYISSLLSVMKSGMVKAAAHITGGGLPGNVERVLPASLGAALDASMWPMPPVFGWLSTKGNISVDEMLRTFNCGIGMVVVTDYERSNQLLNLLNTNASVAFRIGLVNKHTPDTEKVGVTNLSKALHSSYSVHDVNDKVASLTLSNDVGGPKKRVAVLISGSGTNLQALIDFSKNSGNNSSFEIVLVVSNCETAYGLKRAEMAGIPTAVINHKNYKTREEFDDVIHEKLVSAKVEIVCLAGFMRILSGPFVHKWQGRLLNIHPSLLPSFKGMNAHKLVLEAGVRITGCTVHFVAEEVDCGAILAQESVPVCAGDTVEILQERVKTAEHVAYPRALELLCSGKAVLGDAGRIHWS